MSTRIPLEISSTLDAATRATLLIGASAEVSPYANETDTAPKAPVLVSIAANRTVGADEIYKCANFDLPKGTFSGLPGVFADSLPDSFGNALIDKWVDEQKIPKLIVSTLDRLAYVGARGIGALTYEPARGPNTERPSAIEMRQLVEEARRALNGRRTT